MDGEVECEKNLNFIEKDEWQNTVRKDGSWSGKLKNPGKRFFLELARDSVREANQCIDSNGLNFARKAMIRCGLSLDVDGKGKKEQLFAHLQNLIAKYNIIQMNL
jgi:hypothetical protein